MSDKKKQLIETFIKDISIHQVELGDFKRHAILHLNRMMDVSSDSDFKKQINEIKDSLICNEEPNIDLVRLQVTKKLTRIKL